MNVVLSLEREQKDYLLFEVDEEDQGDFIDLLRCYYVADLDVDLRHLREAGEDFIHENFSVFSGLLRV